MLNDSFEIELLFHRTNGSGQAWGEQQQDE